MLEAKGQNLTTMAQEQFNHSMRSSTSTESILHTDETSPSPQVGHLLSVSSHLQKVSRMIFSQVTHAIIFSMIFFLGGGAKG